MSDYVYNLYAKDIKTQAVRGVITVRLSQITLAGAMSIVHQRGRELARRYPNTTTVIDRIQ